MAAIYLSKENETIDLICWRYYQAYAETASILVYEANPNLADLGEMLPAGVKITLPSTKEVEKAAALKSMTLTYNKSSVKLWE